MEEIIFKTEQVVKRYKGFRAVSYTHLRAHETSV